MVITVSLLLLSLIIVIKLNEIDVFTSFKIQHGSQTLLFSNEKSVDLYIEKHGEAEIVRTYLTSSEYDEYFSRRRNILDEHPTPFIELKYYSYEELLSKLKNITESSKYCSLNVYGQSNNNNDLIYITISDGEEYDANKPSVEYIANIHGDEVVGVVITSKMIDYLCADSIHNTRVRKLLENLNMYIIPTMNPDGYIRRIRGNKNYVDLNRGFPDQYIGHRNGFEKEVRAVMEFTRTHPNIILGAHFHGGALCMSYPFDGNMNGIINQPPRYSKSPDDALYKHIALKYSEQNPPMFASTEFVNGITNGAGWYDLYGGIQDWQYLWHDIIDLTVELSNLKIPPESTLAQYWNENFESMFVYAECAYKMGVRGLVVGDNLVPISNATLYVIGIEKNISTNQKGMFYKLLVPGFYKVLCEVTGYNVLIKDVLIPENQEKQITLDFQLKRGNETPICDKGYYGDECQYHNCYSIPFYKKTVCESNGYCKKPDTCVCYEGYNGELCDEYKCNKILSTSSKVCSGNGLCISPDFCECDEDYVGENCEKLSQYKVASYFFIGSMLSVIFCVSLLCLCVVLTMFIKKERRRRKIEMINRELKEEDELFFQQYTPEDDPVFSVVLPVQSTDLADQKDTSASAPAIVFTEINDD